MLSNIILRSTAAFGGTPFCSKKCTALGSAGAVADMVSAGLVNAKKGPVKVLGNGTLTAKVEVVANAFSKSAEEAIQNVGGTATKL